GQLENLHADEVPRSRLARDVQDEIAVAHPGTGAAAETDTVELAERLLLISGLLQLRCDELAYGALECDEQNRGDQRRAGNARHGDPGGTDHGQLTAAGKLPEADERADERGDRQQLIDLL